MASATATPDVQGNVLTVSSDGADEIILSVVEVEGVRQIALNGVATGLAAGPDAEIVVNADAEDDVVDASALVAADYGALTINGDAGLDKLTGGGNNDVINGGDDIDELRGGGRQRHADRRQRRRAGRPRRGRRRHDDLERGRGQRPQRRRRRDRHRCSATAQPRPRPTPTRGSPRANRRSIACCSSGPPVLRPSRSTSRLRSWK